MDEPDPLALSRSWFGLAADELGESNHARLLVTQAVPVDLARAASAFGADAAAWLGEPDGRDSSGLRRYLCDLELRVSPDGRGLFRKAALVSIGDPIARPDGWLIPIEWRATTLAPLFPVFVGHVALSAGIVALGGTYAPPLGVVGQALDRALLSIAARGTARWFLAKVATVVARD